MVLDAVTSAHTRRNYANALDDLFRFSARRPLTRALLQEWKAPMGSLSASTVNVRLSAVRKLVQESRHNGLLSAEAASTLTDVPNVRQQGTRLGNWLTKEQAPSPSYKALGRQTRLQLILEASKFNLTPNHSSKGATSRTHRKLMLVVPLSGVLELRAATR